MKNPFKKWAYHNAFTDQYAKRKANQQAIDQKLIQALNQPENGQAYRKALRSIAIRQFNANLKGFIKWLAKDILWLLVPYFGYGWYQTILTNTLLTKSMDSKTLWGIQEQLMIIGILTGAASIVALYRITQNGWYHRPYKHGELAQQMKASLTNESKTNTHPNSKNRRKKRG